MNVVKRKKYVFMYPDIAAPTVSDIENHLVPKERLVGFYQLRQRGWNVEISDARWKGRFSTIRRRVKRFITIPSMGMFRDWWAADVIVIKDDFSLFLSLAAKLLGKKLVYLDSMFAIPKRRVREILIKLNILLADRVICFSPSQADLWTKRYRVKNGKIFFTHYGIDVDFYSAVRSKKVPDYTQLIAVGRDVGRDFGTLGSAVARKDVTLNLVTLPYLLTPQVLEQRNVKIHERLTYSELNDLYSAALVAVVPLSESLTYPSGIRAVMEAMALGKPVIATRTPVLEEYFEEGIEIALVEPGNSQDLSQAIDKLLADPEYRETMAKAGFVKLKNQYGVEKYVDELEYLLSF